MRDAIAKAEAVPVIIVCRGTPELKEIYDDLKSQKGEDNVQYLAYRDPYSQEELKKQWAMRIDRATKLTKTNDRFWITVTDEWGGRGHDFRALDEDVNGAGGVMVMCTTIPHGTFGPFVACLINSS